MTMQLPKLGIGTWELSKDDINPTDDDAKEVFMLNVAIRNGFNHIDTSSFYRDGKMEQIIGKAISSFRREDLILSSKVFLELDYDGVMRNFEASIKRLGVDYLDIYYAHTPNHEIPTEQTAKAFNRLMDEGLIKHAGVCNATVETLEDYHKRLNGGVFATQSIYNLIIREPKKKGVIDYCLQNNIKFIAYRSIQLPVPHMKLDPVYKIGAYPMLDEVASRYGKSNVEINLKWMLQQEGVHVLIKPMPPYNVERMSDVLNFEISSGDMQHLTDNFPTQLDEGVYIDGTRMPLL